MSSLQVRCTALSIKAYLEGRRKVFVLLVLGCALKVTLTEAEIIVVNVRRMEPCVAHQALQVDDASVPISCIVINESDSLARPCKSRPTLMVL